LIAQAELKIDNSVVKEDKKVTIYLDNNLHSNLNK